MIKMIEVPKLRRAKCEHCGNIQYIRESSIPETSTLIWLDTVSLCCSNPSYWAVDEDDEMVR